ILSVAAALLVLIVLAGAVWWYVAGGKRRNAPKTPVVGTPPVVETPAPQPTPAPPPAIPEGMVAVATGAYEIGRDHESALEMPRHTVQLPAYFIDRTEVTNEAFKSFVDATGHRTPANWRGKDFPTGRAAYPVTGISWQDAADYAAWAGKRLP